MQVFSVALRATRNAWRDLRQWTKPMTKHTPQPPREEGYLLSPFDYDELNTVRDTLMLLAQFAGPSHTPREQFLHLVIPRGFLGQFLASLAHQIGDVLTAVTEAEARANDADAQKPASDPQPCRTER
jgi:hypothetical protein